MVLTHLVERIYARSSWQHKNAPVLAIANEVAVPASHRRNLWHFQRYSTPGYRPRTLNNIVDAIHFAPSSASRLVQAVDLVAFL